MELILASIAAAGLLGASNQYMFVLLLGVTARLGWIDLAPEMVFIGSWPFIIVSGILWVVSVAPAYSSTFSPGIANAINTVSNFVHTFVVPVSAAMVALAAAGVITNMHPDLADALKGLTVFNTETSNLTGTGLTVAGGGAIAAMTLTGAKAAAKPGLNTATGTIGHTSAPLWATIESLASVVLVGLLPLLAGVSPWLLVALFVVIAILMLGLMIYSFYLLWKFGKGMGRVFRLVQQQPRAGWAVIGEFFVFGIGSLVWGYTRRGATRFLMWAAWMLIFLFIGLPAVVVPVVGIALTAFIVMVGITAGGRSAQSLMKRLEKDGHILPIEAVEPPPVEAPAMG